MAKGAFVYFFYMQDVFGTLYLIKVLQHSLSIALTCLGMPLKLSCNYAEPSHEHLWCVLVKRQPLVLIWIWLIFIKFINY